jgi:hypothetical protein
MESVARVLRLEMPDERREPYESLHLLGASDYART